MAVPGANFAGKRVGSKGLNLTLVYTFPMCMAWRFNFPIRNYDFNSPRGWKINEHNKISTDCAHAGSEITSVYLAIIYRKRQIVCHYPVPSSGVM